MWVETIYYIFAVFCIQSYHYSLEAAVDILNIILSFMKKRPDCYFVHKICTKSGHIGKSYFMFLKPKRKLCNRYIKHNVHNLHM